MGEKIWFGLMFGVVILVLGIVEQQRVVPRALVHAFTDQYISPYASVGSTPYHVGNRLIWVACIQSLDDCPKNKCLVNALGHNMTAVHALCAAVQHDCVVPRPCHIDDSCKSRGRTRFNRFLVFIDPCDGDPAGDYEYAHKLTPETLNILS